MLKQQTFRPQRSFRTCRRQFITAVLAFALGVLGSNAAVRAQSTDCSGAAGPSQTVCFAAEAFLETLSSSQQSEVTADLVEENWTAWSNLPCGSGCRNGIQLGSLSSTQLDAALAVAQAALSTAGYGAFDGIRAADDYLQSIGGGSNYDSGIYFIAFLGTPSATTSWMLQLGGHHYALNFTYRGQTESATPYFTGVEPLSFTLAGQTYSPMQNKAAAATALLDSLSSTELAAAEINGSFDDVLLGPDEDGQFPSTPSGLQVSTLSAQKQALVIDMIEAWVNDTPSAVASDLMAAYTSSSALASTHVGWAGATDLASEGSYIRIDGPRLWLEIIAQGGVVVRNQVHYHAVWRDELLDYGGSGDAGVIGFAEVALSVSESTSDATLTVERTGGAGAVTIDDLTVGGSATEGDDYQSVSGTLTWEDGEVGEKTFSVPLVDDLIQEDDEVVSFVLSDPTGGAELGDSDLATLTIRDDDETVVLPDPCSADETTLCLNVDGRFEAVVTFLTSGGDAGDGQAIDLAQRDGGLFYFFDFDNPEMLIKVLDGCSLNDRFWVYFAATTDVAFELTVTDTSTGVIKTYVNTLGAPADAILDSAAFATCD